MRGAYLAFDTETTGLPIWKAPSDDPRQPWITQIAGVLYQPSGQEIRRYCTLIKPDGWSIPKEIVALNGITAERCHKEGQPFDVAMVNFFGLVEDAEFRIGHNVAFDVRIVRIAMKRMREPAEKIDAWSAMPSFCTQKAGAALIVAENKGREYKQPKLSLLYDYLFRQTYENRHDAIADVEACHRSYLEIKRRQGAIAAELNL